MKVITLLQPWASLIFTPVPGTNNKKFAKGWETRSWKPSEKMIELLKDDSLYIHASKRLGKDQIELSKQWPFSDYIKDIRDLPLGVIIGSIYLGEIMTTEGWIFRASQYEDGAFERYAEENQFGDYSPGRYAWKLLSPRLLKTPIPAKGSLSIWDFNHPTEFLQYEHR